MLPFRPPGPFVCSKQWPYSVVVKPTVGTFLIDYINGCNLHVGVTDSFGITYDFDRHGVNRSFHGWDQVLAIDLSDRLDDRRSALWNTKLHEFTAYDNWLPERYAENEHNCYDFVLEFLALMQLEESLPCIATKTDFCREMVLPQTIKAAKYISLFRQLLHEGTVICQTANA